MDGITATVKTREQSPSLKWRCIIYKHVEIHTTWSDQSRVKFFDMVSSQKHDALLARCHAVECVEEA